MKLIAKQIPPEYQKSPLDYDEIFDNIICDGNRDYESRTTREYDLITKYLDDACYDWENREYYGDTLTEILRQYGFEKNSGKRWSPRELHDTNGNSFSRANTTRKKRFCTRLTLSRAGHGNTERYADIVKEIGKTFTSTAASITTRISKFLKWTTSIWETSGASIPKTTRTTKRGSTPTRIPARKSQVPLASKRKRSNSMSLTATNGR